MTHTWYVALKRGDGEYLFYNFSTFEKVLKQLRLWRPILRLDDEVIVSPHAVSKEFAQAIPTKYDEPDQYESVRI